MKRIVLTLVGLLVAGASAAQVDEYEFRKPIQGLGSAAQTSAVDEPESIGADNLAANGVTITCQGMADGETFEVQGNTYRVVYSHEDALTYAASACTSNMTDMTELFARQHEFNENIAHWDVSNVTQMYGMFFEAVSFNQDLTSWCVSNIDDGSFVAIQAFGWRHENRPIWGTCP